MGRVYRYLLLEGEGFINKQEPLKNSDFKPEIYAKIESESAEIEYWREFNRVALNNRYVIFPLCGNTAIKSALRYLEKREDTAEIVVLPDWFTFRWMQDNLNDIKEYHQRKCSSLGIQFRFISGYTFEWMIINTSGLLDLAYNSSLSSNLKVQQNYRLYQLINSISDKDGVDSDASLENNLLEEGYTLTHEKLKAGDKKLNRIVIGQVTFERLCYHVLNDILSDSVFNIEKGKLGECWHTCCGFDAECKKVRLKRGTNGTPLYLDCGLLGTKYFSSTDKVLNVYFNSAVMQQVVRSIKQN